MEVSTILIVAVFALCFFALIKRNSTYLTYPTILNNNNLYYSIIAFLMINSVLVRVYKFGVIPAGFNQDGAMAGVDALALAQHGTDRFGMSFPVHFTAWGYGQMSVLLSYLMVPFIKLFGLSPITARLPMLLISILGILVLYQFIKLLFGRLQALIVLAFISINPWHIMQSRWALDCNLFPHFLLFSLYFLYIGLKKRIYLYLSMFFFALTMYTYGIAFYSIPIILFVICIYLFSKKLVTLKQVIISAIIYIFFAWPIFAVMVINYFKLKTLKFGVFTIPFFPNSMRTNDILIFSKNILNQLHTNFLSLLNVAFIQKSDLPWNSIPEYGPLYLFSFPFIIMGFIYIIKVYKESKGNTILIAGKFILFTWFFTAIFSGIFINNVNINRVNIIFYPLCILTGLGIYYVLFERIQMKILTVIVLIIFSFSFIGFNRSYFGEHSKILAINFYDGFNSALTFAEKSNTEVIYITSYTQSSNSSNVSEILTLFGVRMDSKYFQGKDDSYNKLGVKKLPYKLRYNYVSYNSFSSFEQKNAVYIFNKNERNYFDESKYTINYFQGYGVAVPK